MYEFPLVKISGATPTSGSPSLPSICKPTMLCLRNGSPPLVTVRAIGCSLVQLTPKLEVISDVQELELTETSSAASIGRERSKVYLARYRNNSEAVRAFISTAARRWPAVAWSCPAMPP
jgi:hypothetical protein